MGTLLALFGINPVSAVQLGWKIGKYVLIALAALALVFGIYMTGKAKGETKGYKDGWDAQQVTVAELTKIINDNRTAVATKVKTLEKEAANDTVAIIKTGAVLDVKRNAIVKRHTEGRSTAPQDPTTLVVASCGLSEPAVVAIQELLATQAAVPEDARHTQEEEYALAQAIERDNKEIVNEIF